MKLKIKKKFYFVGIGLFLLSFCKQETQVKKSLEEQPVAKIQFVKGQVKVERDKILAEAKINDLLQTKDILITEKDSSIDIILKDKGIIRINENTRIEIRSLTSDNIEIYQDRGSVISHLKKLKESENYSIITPTSIAAVRGTSFITKVISENKTNIALIEGKIEIKNQKGDTIVLDQAGEINVEKEKELSKKKILPLSKESLQLLKELASQDKGNVQEYVSFVTELKNSSAYKEIAVETNYQEKIEESKKLPEKKITEKLKSSEEKIIQRNVKNDPLKIPTEKDFNKK
ncbi:MAG: FecR domain-containing protein [Leptonema sp. (in: bacteria)]